MCDVVVVFVMWCLLWSYVAVASFLCDGEWCEFVCLGVGVVF